MQLFFLLFIGIILITTGCATNDMAKLKSDVLGLEKKYYDNASKLKEIEYSLSAIRKNQAELGAKIEELRSDLQVLTGRFEEGRYQTEKSLREVTSIKENYSLYIKEIENRLNSLKDRLNSIDLALTNLQPPSHQVTKPSQEAKEADAGDIYREAYSTFRHGDIPTAKEMFKKFLKAYPKGEYSDNAQFWLAECYYEEKDYENAILSYEDLIKKFPKSDKVPMAILKQGYSFYELGDKASGKLLMERVIEKFPKTEEASLAKKKLKEEGPKSPKKKR
jgi:tol-pal system protein YbgF